MTIKRPQQRVTVPPEPGEEYRPTEDERATLINFQARRKRCPPPIKVQTTSKGIRIKPDHPDLDIGQVLIMSALGTVDFDFYKALIEQLANAGSKRPNP